MLKDSVKEIVQKVNGKMMSLTNVTHVTPLVLNVSDQTITNVSDVTNQDT
jgi:hypothetical protein